MKHPFDLDLLSQLVSTPSVSSVNPTFDMGNRIISELLGNRLTDTGCRVELMPVPSTGPERFNVVASFGEGPVGIVLGGHTDTVPIDEDQWLTEPFSGEVQENRLYGVGSSDMKGFFAAVLGLLSELNSSKLDKSIVVLCTADEESSMAGAKALVHEGIPQAKFALIGEPTGNQPIRMHKGILMESIRVQGSSGHSSDPRLGNSALEAMHKILHKLMEYRTALQRKFENKLFTYPHPTINFGAIRGGDNPNRICAECELHLDARVVPGLSVDQVREEIRDIASRVAEDRGVDVFFEALFDGIEALETPAASHIVKCCENLTGIAAGTVDFGTEGPFLTQLGMETVIMGPGDIRLAHQPNEYIDLVQLEEFQSLLSKLVHQLCVDH